MITKKTESFKLTDEICPKCERAQLLISNFDGHKVCVWTFGCDYDEYKLQQRAKELIKPIQLKLL